MDEREMAKSEINSLF